MDDYKEHLRRLTVHDDALVEEILSEETMRPAFALDERTAALVRVAATIAVASFFAPLDPTHYGFSQGSFALLVSLKIFLCDFPALVIKFFPFGNSNIDFCFAVL